VAGTGRRIRRATSAQGAGETGLAHLIELHAVNSAGDMLITVALASTIFFSVPTGQARDRVALYLAITMAPFVLLAPVIGPLLDRLPSGRRAAMAVSMLVRAMLAWTMAGSIRGGSLELYPEALCVLVASKAYGVVRSVVVPRLRPPGITLVKANSRVTLAGLIATGLATALGGLLHLIGPDWPLRGAFLVFIAGALLAFSLPHAVDSARGEHRALLAEGPPPAPRPAGGDPGPAGAPSAGGADPAGAAPAAGGSADAVPRATDPTASSAAGREGPTRAGGAPTNGGSTGVRAAGAAPADADPSGAAARGADPGGGRPEAAAQDRQPSGPARPVGAACDARRPGAVHAGWDGTPAPDAPTTGTADTTPAEAGRAAHPRPPGAADAVGAARAARGAGVRGTSHTDRNSPPEAEAPAAGAPDPYPAGPGHVADPHPAGVAGPGAAHGDGAAGSAHAGRGLSPGAEAPGTAATGAGAGRAAGPWPTGGAGGGAAGGGGAGADPDGRPAAEAGGPGASGAGTSGPGAAGPGRGLGAAGGRRGGAAQGPFGPAARAARAASARVLGQLSVGPAVLLGLRAEGTLRGLSGFLTFYLAFLLREHPVGGLGPAVSLGLAAGALGVGNALGTLLGSLLRSRGPELTVTTMLAAATAAMTAATAFYGALTVVLAAGATGVAQSLGKVALDSLIQRDVPESVRTSAFARSETLMQLGWVVGGGLGTALPLSGPLGMGVGAALLAVSLGLTGRGLVRLRERRHLRPV